MPLELTSAGEAGAFPARDLGFLLHNHMDRTHKRAAASVDAFVFFTQANDETATVVLALDVDPVALLHGRALGILAHEREPVAPRL